MSTASPSRNGPCPCGSGRKYKRCCMPGATQRRGPLDTRDLSTRLLDYVKREYPEHFQTVLMELYGGPLPDRHEQIAAPMALFELPLPSGRTAAQELPSRGLPDELARELAARREAWLSIWEVLDIDPGRSFDAVDLLTGTRARVYESRGSKSLQPRDAILCRVYWHDRRHYLDGIHPARLGPRAADAIVERIRPHIGRARRLGPAQVRNSAVALTLFEAWQASVAAEADRSPRHKVELRNTDGDAFEPTTDTYAHAFADAGELTQLLCSLPGVFEFDSDEPHLSLTRKRNAMHPDWVRTTIAELHVGAEHLRVECNSPRRADHVRALLEQLVDAQLRHLHRSVAPVVTKLVDTHTGPLAVDAQPVSGWLGAPAMEWVLADHLRRWKKRPQSELDGLPPQAAVKQAKLRREVHAQLREMEHRHGPKATTIFARVRAELGLAADGSSLPLRKRDLDLGMGVKASEALLDFARPVLLSVDGPKQGAQVVRVAAEVWNVVGARGGEVPVEQLRDACVRALDKTGVDVDVDELDSWIELLVERRPLFDDRRVFFVTDVGMAKSQFNVLVTSLHPSAARTLYGSGRGRPEAEPKTRVNPPPATRQQPPPPDGDTRQLHLFGNAELDDVL